MTVTGELACKRTGSGVPFKAPPVTWRSTLASMGPAVVVSGSVIGSGEIINVPVQSAKFGFVLFWAIVFACVIKYFLQVELGRHCMVHNRTTVQALNLVPGPRFRGTGWLGMVYIVGYTLSIVFVAGIMAATAGLLTSMLPFSSDPMASTIAWSVVILVAVAVLLWFSIYEHMEKLIAALVFGFSLSAIVALFILIGDPSSKLDGAAVGRGMAFQSDWDDASKDRAVWSAVISLLGGLGCTANEQFMYPYWILEKGYARSLGDPKDEGWEERARGWVRVVQLDAGVVTLLVTLITIAYFLVASATLYGGPVPKGIKVVEEISRIFTETYGGGSYFAFMFGAFCTLFSTLVVAVAASGRMWADLLASMGCFSYDDDGARRRYNRIFQSLYLLFFFGVALYTTLTGSSPTDLVIFGQYINGLINTPLLMVGVIYISFKTDERLRMSRGTAVALLTTAALTLACVVGGFVLKWL